MKELTKHIEALLLENDCVILPQFGGFVTNHIPAQWVEEEGLYLPPYRTVGFNPQLKLNDGLLVQSYMLTHDATYPEATRLVESAIEELVEYLYKDGVVELQGIGMLHRTINGEFHFEATQSGVITPSLYGLSSLGIKTLEQLAADRLVEESHTSEASVKEDDVRDSDSAEHSKVITIRIRREWIANIASVAAAVILFFVLSTPVGNTYIEEENYASLGSVSVFKQVESQSLLTNVLDVCKAGNAVTEAKKATPVQSETKRQAVKEEPVSKQPEATAPAESSVENAATPKTEAVPNTPSAPVLTTTVSPVATSIAPTESVAPEKPKDTPQATVPVTPKKVTTYNVIVASVGSESDAQVAIDDFASKGHAGAFLIKGNGRFRIAIASFESEADAYRKANELKQIELFKDAWVLKSRR